TGVLFFQSRTGRTGNRNFFPNAKYPFEGKRYFENTFWREMKVRPGVENSAFRAYLPGTQVFYRLLQTSPE
ncbi:MAG: hypothetical protein ACLFTB_02475, partial [Desulfovibrionales bacterium]